MMGRVVGSLLPVDVVSHPSWWHAQYGLTFGSAFRSDPATCVKNERRTRQALGDLVLGEADAQPRSTVGPVHLAMDCVVQALLGCHVRDSERDAPWVISARLRDDEVWALKVPELATT